MAVFKILIRAFVPAGIGVITQNLIYAICRTNKVGIMLTILRRVRNILALFQSDEQTAEA